MIVFIITVIVSAFLQSNIGFGFPIVVMTIFPLLFEYSTAVTLCQIIAFASTCYLSVKYYKNIQWKILFPLLGISLIVGAIVTYYSIQVSQEYLHILLGLMLCLLALYFFFFSDKIKIKANIKTATIMGFIAGLGNGLFSIGGPAVVLYLLPAVKDKKSYLATIQAYFLISNVSTVIIRVSKGAIAEDSISYILIGWVCILIGTLLGNYTFKKINDKLLSKLVYLFVLISGLSILAENLF